MAIPKSGLATILFILFILLVDFSWPRYSLGNNWAYFMRAGLDLVETLAQLL